MDKIISPQDIMTNTSEAYVVGALNGAVGTGDDFRADISSIITTRLINYSLKHASEHAVSDAMINRLVKLTTDCEAFTTDLKYYMVKEILAGNKPKFARLMQNANVIKMAVK
jgi:adenylosuccinate lyase